MGMLYCKGQGFVHAMIVLKTISKRLGAQVPEKPRLQTAYGAACLNQWVLRSAHVLQGGDDHVVLGQAWHGARCADGRSGLTPT